MIIYIIVFLIFSFLGWIIDTGYRSIIAGKFTSIGYFNAPLRPIYGFGGLFISLIYKNLSSLNLFMQFFIAWIGLIIIELIGGWFCEMILKKKLWDYSDEFLNYKGWICLKHSIYWLILLIIYKIFLIIINLK